MRCTMTQVPNTSEIAAATGMPLAVVVSPLALPDPRDDQIQVWGPRD